VDSRGRMLWQRQVEGATGAHLALDPHASSVGLDDALGNMQPQPQTAAVFADLAKALKNPGQLRRGNSDSRVAHAEYDFVLLRSDPDRHPTGRRREFDRVADQVGEHLEHASAV